jgi:hypothetical protein
VLCRNGSRCKFLPRCRFSHAGQVATERAFARYVAEYERAMELNAFCRKHALLVGFMSARFHDHLLRIEYVRDGAAHCELMRVPVLFPDDTPVDVPVRNDMFVAGYQLRRACVVTRLEIVHVFSACFRGYWQRAGA